MPRPEDVIRDEIRALSGYHVQDAAGMVKLDAMENPYTLPADVRARIGDALSRAEFNRYPDAAATNVKQRLREVLGVPEGVELVLGNGSDEIIQMLVLATARPGGVVLGLDPSFVMFRLIATFCGQRYVAVPLAEGFRLDVEGTIAAMREHRPALMFIAYPNNPTGNLFEPAAIDEIVHAAPGLVVIDEAYNAFAGASYLNRIGEFDNVVVMRTLSKSGLAGLRLGLLAGRPEWLRHIDKVRLPYNVGVLTQLAAEEALRHMPLLDEQAADIKAERARVHDELGRIPGVTPFASAANFITFRTSAADRIFGAFKDNRILLKNLNGTHPLLRECLRVTVGTREENDRFLSVLRDNAA